MRLLGWWEALGGRSKPGPLSMENPFDPRHEEAVVRTYRTSKDGPVIYELRWPAHNVKSNTRRLPKVEVTALLGFEPALWTAYELRLRPLGRVEVDVVGSETMPNPEVPIPPPEAL